jgi:hypothetical protein
MPIRKNKNLSTNFETITSKFKEIEVKILENPNANKSRLNFSETSGGVIAPLCPKLVTAGIETIY